MELEPTFATSVLPLKRLQALDTQLASMEVTLNLLRYAPGDNRGVMPWSPELSPAYCRQVAAALDLYGSEIDDDDSDRLDSGEAHEILLGETPLLEKMHGQCERLRRVLALSEEVLEAVGSDVMAVAFEKHLELERAGRAHRIKAWWGDAAGLT